MTKGRTIKIATLAASAATAVSALAGQSVLVSVGLGLSLSLINDLFLGLIARTLSWRIASRWPKATAFVVPVIWFFKTVALFVAAYAFFVGTHFPVLPFALSLLGYQMVRVALMIARPDRFVRLLTPEPPAPNHALTGGNAE